jgi:hypothetical protein
MPGSLKFRESTYEGRETGFTIFTMILDFVPSPERSFHGAVEEAATWVSLESNASDDLTVTGAWLIFQKNVLLEQRKAWTDS